MIVCDASVLANALGDDGADGAEARMRIAADDVVGPDLLDVETMSVLRKRWLAGTLSDARFEAAVDALSALPIDRYPTSQLMRRAFELRASVTPYDAVYVALAEGLGCALLTADRRLTRAAGPRCTFQMVATRRGSREGSE